MAWSKESRQSRGYGAAWDRVRLVILRRDADQCQCKYCKAALVPEFANEVDHIVPKAKAKAMGWTQAQMDAESNLQAINRECHKRKSKEDEGKTLRPRKVIGPDGWAV